MTSDVVGVGSVGQEPDYAVGWPKILKKIFFFFNSFISW